MGGAKLKRMCINGSATIFYFKWAIISLYYGYITKWDSVSFHIAAAKQRYKTEYSHGGTGGIACMRYAL